MANAIPLDHGQYAVQCTQCKTVATISITAAEIRRWRGGEYIQNVKPDLSPEQRELLISGICGPCFDRLFGPES